MQKLSKNANDGPKFPREVIYDAQTTVNMEENLVNGARSNTPEDRQIESLQRSAEPVMEIGEGIPASAPQEILQVVAQEASNAADLANEIKDEEQGFGDREIQTPVNGGHYTSDQGPGIPMKVGALQDHDATQSMVMPNEADANLIANTGEDTGPFPDFMEYGEPALTQDTAMTMMTQDEDVMTEAPDGETAASLVESEVARIQAFAKLEFDDGEFYMNTYSVDIGRDIEAARIAAEMEQEVEQSFDSRPRKRSASTGDAPRTPKRARRDSGRHYASSVISESGGIIGVDFDRKGDKRRKSKSTTSSSLFLSRKSSVMVTNQRTDYQALAMASLGELYMDPRSSMPHPDACPLVPIHPPSITEGVPTGHKGISRKHVKIAFNFEKHLFEVTITGRNGAFVDEEWYPEGDTQPLKSGSFLQIGGVGIRFLLPDVALGETGAESSFDADPATGGKMSFDFEDGRGDRNNMADSSEIGSDEGDGVSHDNDDDDESDREDDDDDDNEDGDDEGETEDVQIRGRKELVLREEEGPGEDANEESEEDLDEEEPEVVNKSAKKPSRKVSKKRAKMPVRKPVRRPAKKPSKKPAKPSKKLVKPASEPEPEPKPLPEPPKPKRKGPGRPPKNGIISKREQALLARQAREAAKATALEASGVEAPRGSGKNADPDQDIKQEDGSFQPNGKRKYKKRKSKADGQPGEQNAVRESTEHTDSVPPEQLLTAGAAPKPPKEKKPPKPPRSPSPVYDESTMTPEQLAKPNSSYVVLIHEALTNSKTGAMSLPQIYRAIERKYPFYKLRVQTTGWQSSVRHNLSQHPAFRKIERDGKGWMWGLVPEVSIEKEKKRRHTPPPMPPQHYYPANPQLMQPPHYYPGMPPPNGYPPGQPGQPPYGMYPGMPPGHMHPPPNHLPLPLGPKGIPPPLINAQADTSSTYQSPYQSAPPVKPPPSQSSQPPPPPQSDPPPQQNGSNGYPANPASQPPPPPLSNPNPQPTTPSPSPTPYPQQSPRPPQQSSYAQHSQPQPQLPHPLNPTHRSASTIGQDVLSAVNKFKTVLIESMDDKARAEALVTSAINRTLGISNFPSLTSGQQEDDPQEKTIMQALSSMLGNLTKKTQEAQRMGSQPPAQVQAQWAPQPVPVPQGSQAILQILQQAGRGASVPPPAPTPQQSPPSTAPLHPAPTESPPTDVPANLSAPTTIPSAPVFPEVKRELNVAADGTPSRPDPIGVERPLEGGEEGAMDAGQLEAKKVVRV